MLVAVAGLSGAGKTTAVEHLQSRGVGTVVYVGGYVRAEVRYRGLAPTPENEQLVRQSLRVKHGPEVLAKMAVDDLQGKIEAGTILLDAICVKAECDFYRGAFGSRVVVIGLDVSFETRAARLAGRANRPFSEDQLRQRDQFELDELRLEDVLAVADHRLSNEDSLEAFKSGLDALSSQW